MAETTDADNSLALPEQDAGVLFRAEMAAQNFVLGYWKAIVGIIVAGLVAILLYGQYDSWYKGRQQAWASEIVYAELKHREAIGAALSGLELSDEQQTGLREMADDLVTLANGATGPVASEAYLKAAEYYRILGDSQAALGAFDAAIPHSKGIAAYSAHAGRAGTLVETGDNAGAIAEWQTLSATNEGFLGAWATLSLARTHAVAGDDASAAAAYEDLLVRFPDSSLSTIASEERAGLSGAAPAPVPPAPVPATPEPTETPEPAETP